MSQYQAPAKTINQPIAHLGFVKLVLFIYPLLFFGDALDAYNIGPIPIAWLSKIAFIALAFIIFFASRFVTFPLIVLGGLTLFWATIVSLLNLDAANAYNFSSLQLSVRYPFFIILRFFSIIAFISVGYVTFWLLVQNNREKMIKLIVWMGVLASLLAFYIYFAQLFGFSELARNRTGTTGSAQQVIFSSLPGVYYLRAMGTFREPSFFAAWLIIPFFLSYIYKKSLFNLPAFIISTAILLSWSLSCILAIIIASGLALLFGLVMTYKTEKIRVKSLINVALRLSIPFLLALILAQIASSALFHYGQKEIGARVHESRKTNIGKNISTFYAALLKTSSKDSHKLSAIKAAYWDENPNNYKGSKILYARVQQLMKTKFADSDRGYVYKYVMDQSIPVLGQGLGNANITFSQYLFDNFFYSSRDNNNNGRLPPVSFLSLYINFAYSVGWIGLGLLIILLAFPVAILLIKKVNSTIFYNNVFYLLSAYFAWLIMFATVFEELTQSFAVISAFLIYALKQENFLLKIGKEKKIYPS